MFQLFGKLPALRSTKLSLFRIDSRTLESNNGRRLEKRVSFVYSANSIWGRTGLDLGFEI